MRFIYSKILCTCSLLLTTNLHAAEASINLYLSGEVTEITCGVLIGDKEKKVDLGTNATNNLKKVGDRTMPVAIQFNLSNCPASGSVGVTFNGIKDVENNELLSLDKINNSASNIAIEISDKNKKRLPLGTKSGKLIGDVNGNISTLFYANYIVTKGSATPGIANANAEFTITYE
ncbi:fimbrial protein [Acinetobacter guillouiae]|uniref:fimbrial protein n=1 Tax=Acinetobacter guillouiae TaxID=106649 RepID=UPI003AF7FB97